MIGTVDVDTARAEYARWFVKQYYLDKHPEPYWEGISRWLRAVERGYIRYYVSSSSEYLIDERDYYGRFDGNSAVQWWRIAIEDVDLEINDPNTVVQSYRKYRQYAVNADRLAWLRAEAEWHVVTNEAWLRAYGVDLAALCS